MGVCAGGSSSLGHRKNPAGLLFPHPSMSEDSSASAIRRRKGGLRRSTMILTRTFLCSLLILEQLSSPVRATALPLPPTSNSNANLPSRSTTTNNANSNNNARRSTYSSRSSQLSPSTFTRRRRDPSPRPTQEAAWLYPPQRQRAFTTNSNGLAYRSILPIRSNHNHYTGLYRNRNLFSGDDSGDNYNYNYNGLDIEDQQSTPSPTPTVKSAPATEVGRISATQEMKKESLEGYNKDASLLRPSTSPTPKPQTRVPKFHHQESPIVFPGNMSRPTKRTRPPKTGSGTTVPVTGNNQANVDESLENYTPKPFDALDKVALESLKALLEKKRASEVNSRTSNYGGRNILEIKGRPKCIQKNDGYCENIETYPKEFLNNILKNSLTLSPGVFQEVFGDGFGNKTASFGIMSSGLAGRDGLQNVEMDSPLCTSVEHTIYPKVAQNKDGDFMYIVNHDEYIQGVRVEKCLKENSPCNYLEGSLTGFSSTCRQKYIYRKLLAFTRTGEATTDTFRLPACCVCHVRSLFVDDRIGSDAVNSYVAPNPNPTPHQRNTSDHVQDHDHHYSDSGSENFNDGTEISLVDDTPSPTVLPPGIFESSRNGSLIMPEEELTEEPPQFDTRMF